jgi:ABC-2 type transport system permease protein
LAGIILSTDASPGRGLRPLIAIGSASVMLLSAIQLIGNQFGYDRAGFRAFVLAPIPRREILIGKNLAVAPLAVGMGILLALVVGCVYPMRPDHYVAVIVQLVASFFLFCLMANALSILAPMAIASGAMKASDVKIVPVLLQFVVLMVMPFAFIPALLPIGVEALLNELDVLRGWPVSLALSLIFLVISFFFYRAMIRVEGDWLAAREQKVLEVVTSKSE